MSIMADAQTENPYATPASEAALPERILFQDIPTKDLKKLRNDSHTIRTVAFLIFLGFAILCIVLIGVLVGGVNELALEHGIMLALAVWYPFVLTGLVKRTNWGRILGIISGVLMLAGIPVGTLIGILFLVSLSRSKRLFGPERLFHKDLETEWKYRKRNAVP